VTTRLHARAILFDMDGTLVDSTPVVEMVWRRFAAEHGLDGDEILAHSHGIKAIDTIRKHAPHIDADAAAADLAAFELGQNDGIIEVPGSATFVRSLNPHEFAVVTSAPSQLARVRLALCDIPIPEVLVGAEDVERGKPDPDPYLKAAAALGVAPEDCIVFEDAPAGIQAGIAAGMRVVVVNAISSETPEGLPGIPNYLEARIERSGDGFDVVLG
jgi:sugar-phosphatase